MPYQIVQKLKGRRSGFSLIELVVIVGIVGILAGVGTASFFKTSEHERMRNGSRILSAWLEDQRRKAIQNSSACDITVNYQSQITESTCDFDGLTETLNLRIEISESRLTLLDDQGNLPADAADNTQWSFSPRGTTTAGVELRLRLDDSEDGSQRCINIMTPLGLVRQGRLLQGESECDFTTAY